MKSSRLLLPALPAAFACGWFLRPVPPPSAVPGPLTTGVVTSGAGSLSGGATAKGLPPTAPGDAPVIGFKPFTSLQEILDTLGEGNSQNDEVGLALLAMEVVPRLFLTDPGTVHAILEELMNSDSVESDIREIVSLGLMLRWMSVQPELALAYSLAHPAVVGGNPEMNLLGLAWLAKTRPEGAKALAKLMPENRQREVEKVLSHIEGQTDPASTLKDPSKWEGLEEDQAGALAARWMRTDPVAALAWLGGLTAEQRSPDLIAAIATVRMQQDAASTLAWIATLPDETEKTASRDAILRRSLQNVKDETALGAKLALLPSEWHDIARLQWLSEGSPQNGTGSADQMKSLLSRSPALAEEETAQRAAGAVARAFAIKDDFTGGADWILSLPPGKAQGNAASSLMNQWTGKDPEAASAWVTSLPPGPTREQAAISMIQQIQREDPASALVWSQSLTDPAHRKSQTQQVFQSWFRKEPLAAVSAIQNLPPEDQQQIFSK